MTRSSPKQRPSDRSYATHEPDGSGITRLHPIVSIEKGLDRPGKKTPTGFDDHQLKTFSSSALTSSSVTFLGVRGAKHSTDTSFDSTTASASMASAHSASFSPVAAQYAVNLPPSDAGAHFPPMKSLYSLSSHITSSTWESMNQYPIRCILTVR